MKKKDLLYPYPKPKPGKTSGGGIRVYYLVSMELLNKIKALAYWERVTMKEIVENAITEYVYKKASVKLKNPPQESTGNNEIGMSHIIKGEIADKINAMAYWEKEKKKVIFDKALKTYINKYEDEKGIILPKPKPKKE